MRTVIKLLKPVRGAAETLTVDNGSEFADHDHVAKELGLAAYFCDLYCSGQQHSNENTNGLLRHYYPKGRISPSCLKHTSTAWLSNRITGPENDWATGHRQKFSGVNIPEHHE